MTLRTETGIDRIGWQILRELQRDARLSYNELGRRVGLSAPAAAERVRRLEEAGVISGYSARLEPAKIGLSLTAFVRLRCTLGKCLLNTAKMEDFPEVCEVHKLSSHHCTLLKVMVASVSHLDVLVDRLSKHGEPEAEVVLSSPMPHREIDWERDPEDLEAITEYRWGRKEERQPK